MLGDVAAGPQDLDARQRPGPRLDVECGSAHRRSATVSDRAGPRARAMVGADLAATATGPEGVLHGGAREGRASDRGSIGARGPSRDVSTRIQTIIAASRY